MSISFDVSELIPATPDDIYDAWLSSERHSKMTGGAAKVSNSVGGGFEVWDGYIQGKNVELIPTSRIVQEWRTTEFEDSDEDSLLEIVLASSGEGTLITIRHSNLPDHGMQYKQGWIDAYFVPMKAYFGPGM
jgi:activator of HSP90 ATPase